MGRGYGADDDALRARAIALRRSGATLAAIKAELGVGSTRLSRWLEREPPVPVRDRSRPWSERRRRAHELRAAGISYRQIEAQLGVPKSTLSSWLCDVPLSDEQRAQLSQRSQDGIRSRAVAIRAGRIRRTALIQAAAAAEIGHLTDRELFLLGVVAYWCEGSKAKPWSVSDGVSFINSDPDLIRLFLAWLRLLQIADEDLRLNLSIHERADVVAATAYWADVVARPVSDFGPAWLKRHNPSPKRRNVDEGYVGCLVIGVRRGT